MGRTVDAGVEMVGVITVFNVDLCVDGFDVDGGIGVTKVYKCKLSQSIFLGSRHEHTLVTTFLDGYVINSYVAMETLAYNAFKRNLWKGT